MEVDFEAQCKAILDSGSWADPPEPQFAVEPISGSRFPYRRPSFEFFVLCKDPQELDRAKRMLRHVDLKRYNTRLV